MSEIHVSYTYNDYVSWHQLHARFENEALNSILFGTFTVLTSTFFYRYIMLQANNPQKAQSIDLDWLLLAL
jgi:hypothetical protein